MNTISKDHELKLSSSHCLQNEDNRSEQLEFRSYVAWVLRCLQKGHSALLELVPQLSCCVNSLINWHGLQVNMLLGNTQNTFLIKSYATHLNKDTI